LEQLIAERDKNPSVFFSPGDRHSLLKSFKLLHLRWILKLETGYRRTLELRGPDPPNMRRPILRMEFCAMEQCHNCGSCIRN